VLSAKCQVPNAICQFDVAIIGGGPAGSSAAIIASRAGAKVALFEARSFPRHKVCGEFVSAESLDLLAGLLRDVPRAQSVLAGAPVIETMRLLFRSRVNVVEIAPVGLSITRYDLDALLWEAARRSGVETCDNCEITVCEGEGPFALQTASGQYLAKAVIVAAGRWSQFTADRTLPAGPKWIGVKGHFREPNPAPSTDLHFFQGGYCGIQPVASDVVNACAMVRSDHATSLQQVFELHPELTKRCLKWEPVTQPVVTAPLVYRQPQAVRGSLVFVGDAAAFIDPFAGDGISIALRSGRAAAECLGEFLGGRSSLARAVAVYQQEYERKFAPLVAAAARVRSLLSLPEMVKPGVFELLRLPGLIPYLIRKTRRAN